ncbi:MAG: NHLP bacteriocin export ABC transporter permease/ATPase subunit [Acidobacteria bacterium]|nr:MAG: NHLP bacteriocin export ABC transporter permease/ATPase subunit [Acidobacteriota bacterium]
MALFSVMLNRKVPEGARRYLFSLGSGEALFGTALSSQDHCRAILALPVEETELRKIPAQHFGKPSNDADLTPLVEHWIYKLESLLSELVKPATSVPISPGQPFSLTPGQVLQSRQDIVWLQVHRGNARWMGLKEMLLGLEAGVVPLGPGMWLEAEGTVEGTARGTSAIIQDTAAFLKGLQILQKNTLSYINLSEQRELEEQLDRLQERERLNVRLTQDVIGDLASVVNPLQKKPGSREGVPLLVAARAVGQALGIEICPPARSVDLSKLKEPLKAIEQASRIRMRKVLLTEGWWKEDCGPLLAHKLEDHQPVALLPVSPSRYELLDPVNMNRVPVSAAVASSLSPVAYMPYRSLPERRLGPLDLLKFGLRGHRRDLLIILTTGIAGTLLAMFVPVATAILIDNAIPDADRGLLRQLGMGLLAAAFGRALFELVQGFVTTRLETDSTSSSQAAVWDRLLQLRPSFFRRYSTGDLASRVTAISQIRQKLSVTTLQTLFSSCISLLNLFLMFYYSVQLALTASAIALLTITFTTVSGFFTFRKLRPLQAMGGKIFGLTVQLMNGVSKLRVSGAEGNAFAFWGKKYSDQQKLIWSIQSIQDGVHVLNQTLPALTSALIFWLAALALQEGSTQARVGLTAGAFLAFNSAFGIFMGGAAQFSNTVIEMLDVFNLWERATPILTAEPEVDRSKTDPGKLSGRLALDHVTFRYRETGPLTLEDMNLHAEPGEFIALVGPSGGGKSTIFRLLLGFETPESGTIYYDGQDLSGLDVYAVRRQLGVVLQNNSILAASIFENIASSAMISLDEAWAAARAAGLAEDISSLPMGMHTYISEGGTNLSGGQRQRLLIARALILQPRILLFDEATSALDNQTQAIVSDTLDRLRVTRIVIAHRLSTIRKADRIYVLEAGRIVQNGTFEELARQDGLFSRLMARQMI